MKASEAKKLSKNFNPMPHIYDMIEHHAMYGKNSYDYYVNDAISDDKVKEIISLLESSGYNAKFESGCISAFDRIKIKW